MILFLILFSFTAFAQSDLVGKLEWNIARGQLNKSYYGSGFLIDQNSFTSSHSHTCQGSEVYVVSANHVLKSASRGTQVKFTLHVPGEPGEGAQLERVVLAPKVFIKDIRSDLVILNELNDIERISKEYQLQCVGLISGAENVSFETLGLSGYLYQSLVPNISTSFHYLEHANYKNLIRAYSEWYEVDAYCDPGMSGGLAFNQATGQAVGMIFKKLLLPDQSMRPRTLFVSLVHIKNELERLLYSNRTFPYQYDYESELVIYQGLKFREIPSGALSDVGGEAHDVGGRFILDEQGRQVEHILTNDLRSNGVQLVEVSPQSPHWQYFRQHLRNSQIIIIHQLEGQAIDSIANLLKILEEIPNAKEFVIAAHGMGDENYARILGNENKDLSLRLRSLLQEIYNNLNLPPESTQWADLEEMISFSSVLFLTLNNLEEGADERQIKNIIHALRNCGGHLNRSFRRDATIRQNWREVETILYQLSENWNVTID